MVTLQISVHENRILFFSIAAPSDFDEESRVLNFSSVSTVQTLAVTIKNDTLLEGDEQFTVMLEVVNVENTLTNRVRLQPNVAAVYISDDDGEC